MAKDRATPFSFKHRRTWLTVTGGMVALGVANVALGYLLWPDVPGEDLPPERIIPVLPRIDTPRTATSASTPAGPGATIGPGAAIGPGATIDPGATIGTGAAIDAGPDAGPAIDAPPRQ